RLAAVDVYWYLTMWNAGEKLLLHFHKSIPILLKMFECDDMMKEETPMWKMKSIHCIENVTSLPASIVNPHLDSIFSVAVRLMTHPERDSRVSCLSILTGIFYRFNYKEISSICGVKRIDDFSKGLLETAATKPSSGLLQTLSNVISAVATSKDQSSIELPELIKNIEKWAESDDFSYEIMAIRIVRDAPGFFYSSRKKAAHSHQNIHEWDRIRARKRRLSRFVS
ncbi:hypothetical protein PENTCL1PPCAC_6210, partial [Pristionchus entomophagus]